MALKHTALLATLAVVALGLAAREAWQLERLATWNEAIDSAAPRIPKSSEPPPVRFAAAFALGKKGQLQQALDLYRQIETESTGRIRHDSQFNAGNLLLQQAATLVARGDKEGSAPLLELAKETYRDALRDGNEDWDVRYNLERALRLSPELTEDAADLAPPPQSDRSPTTVRISPTPGGP